MRGRKPTPKSLRELRGNPQNRPTDMIPSPKVIVPACPKDLDSVASKEWKRIAPLLVQNHLISDMDLAVLAGYCHSFSLWVQTLKKIKKGLIIKSPSGYPIMNPYLSINNNAKTQMLKFAQELGISPVQRSRLKIDNPDRPPDQDKMKKFIEKKR